MLNDAEIVLALKWLYSNNDTPCKQVLLSLMLGTENSRIFALIKDTDISKFTHHDLCRTFSSKLAEMGYSLDLIDSTTNHKLQGIRQNYVHTNRLDERYSMLCDWCNYLGNKTIVNFACCICQFASICMELH